MKTILVTGGCGYIGSHTIVDLIDHGFNVICADNNSRSEASVLDGVETITGKKVMQYDHDLTDAEATRAMFADIGELHGIIHFAAYKSVPESVREPELYWHNNIKSLENLLECVHEFNVPNFVFSSSCSVYGNATDLPVTESTILGEAQSPYAATKQEGEKIIRQESKGSPSNFILLRYFNPVGAHASAKIGENPHGTPENLVPYITQTAAGKLEQLTVYGGDYPTRDGTNVRDYIHVMDIAHAHTLALQYLIDQKNESNCEVYNLGTGIGVTVLEAIQAFEKVSEQKLNYVLGDRREGDVVAIYANNDLAKGRLGWEPTRDVEEMMRSAWAWETR
jgi:UDP-glucose 4-epimerase